MPAEVPPVDLTTAVFDAVNIALQLAGIDPLSLLLGAFSGRPKFEDTYALIAGLNQSAYWPLHALASDLSIAAKNGAPISDSNPAIQTTFAQWKRGAVLSMQGVGQQFQGETGQGFWTLFNLLLKAWEYSKDGVDGVLRFVHAMDTIVTELAKQPDLNPYPTPQPGPLPGPNLPTWPWGPLPAPCFPPVDPNDDELGQGLACLAENGATLAYIAWQIYQLLLNPPAAAAPPPAPIPPPPVGGPPPTDTQCCDNIVAAINAEATAVATAGDAVAKAIASASGAAPVDLTALIVELKGLNQNIGALEQCVCQWLGKEGARNDAANALGAAIAAHWATLFPGDPGTTQLVLS
jgi:hypothetical protein